MTADIRLATRRSSLALAQARAVERRLKQVHGPDIRVELVEIDSSGDLDRVSGVAMLTEMGAFVRAVQAAVLDGRADGAVHSLKDLPTTSPAGLIPVAFPERAAPWDVIVGATLGTLPSRALVGTGSPRRIAQLRVARPDLRTTELRGNVDTRLRMVRDGEVGAAILAAAGLARLDKMEVVAEVLGVDIMVPAPGQGTLVVEARDGGTAAELLRAIDDPEVRVIAETERMLLAETGAGCRSALGALASREGGSIRLDAFVQDDRGIRKATVSGDRPDDVIAAARKELLL